MRRLLDLPLLVILVGIGAVSMAVPALHAVAIGDHAIGRAFFYTGALVLVVVAMLSVVLWNLRPVNVARSHLLQLVAAYLLLPAILAWPMTEAMPNLGLFDTWFEMVSSFTTTGATIFDLPLGVPASIHLWRAMVGWMGGFLTLLAAVAILAPMNLGGFEVISGQVVGRGASGVAQIARIADPSRRIQRFAGQMLPVYAGLTLLLAAGLLAAGDDALVAVCHAMATLSTSGISPLNGVAEAASERPGQAMVLLFGVFVLSRQAFPGVSRRLYGQQLLGDPEFRVGLFLVVAATFLVATGPVWDGLGAGNGQPEALRQVGAGLWGAFFTVSSFLTTTGFVSPDWPGLRQGAGGQTLGLVLVGLALVGGGVATTAGGVKLLRIVALYRMSGHGLSRLAHPRSVGRFGGEARDLRQQAAHAAWIFLFLFLISLTVVMAGLTLTGVAWDSALVFGVAALTNTGPLATIAGPEPLSYAALGAVAKAVLAAAMVLGRLELLAVLALLAPDTWRT